MRRLLLGTTAAALLLSAPAMAAPFSFVAIGDMPYKLPDDYARFERLIGVINGMAPAFTVHVGDIKSGSTPCSDENFEKVRGMFDGFEQPLYYTPGDNEWTDCHREKAGGYEPLERLGKLRELFFGEARSHGSAPVALERQADLMPEHAAIVENARWSHEGVLFATIHVVGSNNGFERNLASAEEFFAREKANVAWIEDSFARAEAADAPAMVLAFQANPGWSRKPSDRGGEDGFAAVLAALAKGAEAFGRPVLLVQGDDHVLVIDQPLLDTAGKKPLENVMRLQVMGAGLVHGVTVTVDPEDPAVFGFKPLVVPDNRRTAQAG
ncbi:hypothetical protein [Marinimicrococcus flavescens]|uniref:Calcineurin-like phosphoesterase domain-containing protein n=1 Tax=Marinimicrococcus flavescens TaxID=3031815 RepID=A0AAP3XQT7_9PROT|nr:hypothetical protein [Marinimicrococcus flavescens]